MPKFKLDIQEIIKLYESRYNTTQIRTLAEISISNYSKPVEKEYTQIYKRGRFYLNQ